MDFGAMFGVLRRRWRVSVPVLLLTVFAAAGLYIKWPTTYQSDAEITLIGSPALGAQPGNDNNPYYDIGSLGPLASILASNLSSDQSVQELAALGVTDAYTAQVPAYAAGPFIEIALTGKSPLVMTKSWPIVIRFTEERLMQVQTESTTKVPTKGLIGATVIAPPSNPKPVAKRKVELVAGVAVLGLIATVILSFSAEARAMRRTNDPGMKVRSRHSGRQRPAVEEETTEHAWKIARTP